MVGGLGVCVGTGVLLIRTDAAETLVATTWVAVCRMLAIIRSKGDGVPISPTPLLEATVEEACDPERDVMGVPPGMGISVMTGGLKVAGARFCASTTALFFLFVARDLFVTGGAEGGMRRLGRRCGGRNSSSIVPGGIALTLDERDGVVAVAFRLASDSF